MFKERIGRLQKFISTIGVMLMITSCQSSPADSISMWLQPNTATTVSFPLMAASQIYSFTADPVNPTQLSLLPITSNLVYSAEIRDSRGSIVATVGGSSIRNANLLFAPSSDVYAVTIKTNNVSQQGMLSVEVASGVPAATSIDAVNALSDSSTFQPISAASIAQMNSCTLTNNAALNVNVRNGPGLNYAVIGSLASRASLVVRGRANGWLEADYNGQMGWVSERVVGVNGNCANLPDLSASIVQAKAVPTNSDTFELLIDLNSWGSFSETLASNDTSLRDTVRFEVANLSPMPPDNYREFMLLLQCSGNGVEHVRWGAPELPTLHCGDSIVIPFTPDYDAQLIAITLPDSSGMSQISYTLTAMRRA